MANSNIQYTIGFNADTSKAKKQIMELRRDLDKLLSFDGNLKELKLDKDLHNAAVAAKDLQTKLELATSVDTGKLDLSTLSKSLKKSGKTLSDYAKHFENLGPEGEETFKKISKAIMNSEPSLRKTNKLLNEMAVSLKNTIKWQVSSSAVHAFMGAIQGAYGYAEDLNKSLTNIRIVTSQSAEDMAKFAKQANKAAKELSVSTTAYTDAALIYYQQGLTDEEVRKRTETTVKMSNVTGESASDVSSYMTAIWNNFAEGSDNLEYFSDVITALGAATAASSEEIAGGLEKFASIGKTVGLSYEYATAALATIIDKTRQSEDVVGTALKTIFARIQGLQQGEEQEDGVTLNKYSQALANVGIQIMDTSGNLKEMDTILDEMGAKWKTLSEAQQVALAQTVGGTRQYAQLISLMNNWDAMQKNLNEAYGSTGTLEEQAKIYAESWEAAQKRVTAALETIYNQLINDKFFIALSDMLTGGITLVSQLIDTIGGLPGVLIVAGSAMAMLFKDSIPKAMSSVENGLKRITGASTKENMALKEEAYVNYVGMVASSNSIPDQKVNDFMMPTETKNEKNETSLFQKAENFNKNDYAIISKRVETEKQWANGIRLQYEEAVKALAEAGEAINAGNKEIDDLIETLEQEAKSTKKNGKPTKKAEKAAKKIEALKAGKTNKNISIDEIDLTKEERKVVDEANAKYATAAKQTEAYYETTRKLATDQALLNEEIEDTTLMINKEKDAMIEGVDANDEHTQSALRQKEALNNVQQGFIGCGEVISSTLYLLNAWNSVSKVMNDESLTVFEKVEAIIPQLLAALPALIAAIDGVSRATKLFNATSMDTIRIKTLEIFGLKAENAENIKGSLYDTIRLGLQQKINIKDKESIVITTAKTIAQNLLNLSLSQMLLLIGAIVVIGVGLVHMFNQWKKSTPEYKLQKANEELEKSQKAASEASAAYNDLKSSIDSLESAQETLSGLTEGTREWKEAVLQVNNQVLDLIDKYPELAQYLTNKNGVLGITEEGLDIALDNSMKRAEATAQQVLYNQASAAKFSAEVERDKLEDDKLNLTQTTYQWKDGAGNVKATTFSNDNDDYYKKQGYTKSEAQLYTNLSQGDAYKLYEEAKKANLLDDNGKIAEQAKSHIKITDEQIKIINENIASISKFSSAIDASTKKLNTLSAVAGKGWVEKNRKDLSDAQQEAYGIGVGKLMETNEAQSQWKNLTGDDLIKKYAGAMHEDVDKVRKMVADKEISEETMNNYFRNEAAAAYANKKVDEQVNVLKNTEAYKSVDTEAKLIAEQWVASGGDDQFIDALDTKQFDKMQEFFRVLNDTAFDQYFGEGATAKAKALFNDKDGYRAQAEKNRIKRFNEREDKLETDNALDDKAMDQYQESRVKALEKGGLDTKALKDANGKLKENDELILDITEDSLKWSKNGQKVADMLEEQKEALSNPKDAEKYGQAMTKLSKQLSEWTGLEGIDSAFTEKMYKDGTIQKMLDGDKKAIIKFYEEYSKIQVEGLTIPDYLKTQLSTWYTDFYDQVKNNKLEIGIDYTDYVNGLVTMLSLAGNSATEINKELEKIGFEPTVIEIPINDFKQGKTGGYTYTDPLTNQTYTVPEDKWEEWTKGKTTIPFATGAKYKGVGSGGIGNKIKPTKKSGGSKSSKKDKKKASDEIERYHKIKETLDALEKQYDSISKKKDRAFGKEKLDYIDQEISKTKELTKAQEQYIKEIEANAKKDKAAVEKLGAKIDSNGVITNYDELINKLLNKFNNSARGEKDEEEYNKAKEIIKQWEETADLLADEKQKLLDYINQELDQKLEKIEYELEIRIQISDDSLKYLDYLLNRIEDQAFSTAEAINLLGDKIQENMTQNEANKKSLIDALGLAGIDAKTIEKILAGDQEAIKKAIESGKIDANVIESIRKYRDGLMDSDEAIRELQKTIDETLIKALDDAEEEFGKLNEVLEHNQNVLSGLQNIMDLTGESILGPMGDVKKAIQQSQLDTATTKISVSYDKAAAARKAYEDAVKQGLSQDVIDAAAEKMRQAEEELLSDTEAAIEAANEIFKSALEETIKSFSDTVAGLYGSMDELKDAFDKQKELNDIYVDDYKKIYELTKLSRDLSKSIDDTDSIKAKNALKNLQAEINELQKQGVELSEYDISYLQKKYELKLAEIALEEAQNAKSTVRMTRDSEGNWSYTYTASQEDIDKAQQNYEDKLYAIQELSDNYIEDMQSQIIDLISRYEDEMANINFSEEGWEQKAAEIEAFYKAKFNLLAQQFEGALGNQSEIYGEWEDYSALTGYGISANQDFIDSFDETTLSQLTGFQTIGEYQEAFVASTKKVMQDLTTSFATWEANVKKIYEEAGLSVDEFGNVVKKTAEQVEKDNKKISDFSEDLKEKVKNNFEEGAKTAAEVAKKWNKAISSMTEENEKLIKSINDIIKGWAKLDEQDNNKKKEDKKEEPENQSGQQQSSTPSWDKVKGAYNKIISGAWGNGAARIAAGKAAGYTEEEIKMAQQLVNKVYGGMSLSAAKTALGFDTGGYTGVWGSSGRLAFLHEKELVLNADDTTNILKSIEMIRSISQLIDLKAASSAFSNLTSATALTGSQTITQEITINAEFPDATDRDEISAAFDNLFIRASQYANRK